MAAPITAPVEVTVTKDSESSRVAVNRLGKLHSNERGFSLIESVVSIGILTAVTVSVAQLSPWPRRRT